MTLLRFFLVATNVNASDWGPPGGTDIWLNCFHHGRGVIWEGSSEIFKWGDEDLASGCSGSHENWVDRVILW